MNKQKNYVDSGMKFKSSYAIGYYDKRGKFDRLLFNNKKHAKEWCKLNKVKGCKNLR